MLTRPKHSENYTSKPINDNFVSVNFILHHTASVSNYIAEKQQTADCPEMSVPPSPQSPKPPGCCCGQVAGTGGGTRPHLQPQPFSEVM